MSRYQIAVGDSPVLVVDGTVSSAQILSMFTTPVELVSAPGVGKVIQVLHHCFYFDYGTVQYTSGGTLSIRWSSGTSTNNPFTAGNIQGAVDVFNASGSFSNPIITAINTSLQLTNATADFATGDGVIYYSILYRIANVP